MDEEDRKLEHQLAAGGGTDVRLRYARALERAGRRDDAVKVLLDGADDAEVRRVLGGISRWGELEATNRFADVKPITRTPRLAWTAPVLEGDGRIEEHLFASPVAVLYERTRHGNTSSRSETAIFDPATGASRATLRGRIRGFSDTLLIDSPSLKAYDLWTGKALEPAKLAKGKQSRSVAPAGTGPPLVASTGRRIYAESSDPSASLGSLWEIPGQGRVLVVSPEVVVELPDSEPQVRSLDRSTGKVRWTAAVPDIGRAQADARGVVAYGVKRRPDRDGGGRWGIIAFDDGGRELWRTDEPTTHLVLTPERVLSISETTISVLDRDTGRPRGRFDPPAPSRPFPNGVVYDRESIAVARDVIYIGEQSGHGSGAAAIGVRAYTFDGKLLWRIGVSEAASAIHSLVAVDGRIYGLVHAFRVPDRPLFAIVE